MRRFLICVGLTLLLPFFCGGEIQALTTIDTTPAWLGASTDPFGYPSYATFGQVITVPAKDSALTSFSFTMDLPVTCTFRGLVYAWDGTKATGPALYESPTSLTLGSGYEEITFYPMGLELTPGAQYVLFVSTSKDNGSGTGLLKYVEDVYPVPNNTFVFLDNGTDESLWTAQNWSTELGADLAFRAAFVTPTRRILYWTDLALGTDYMGEALKNAAIAHAFSVTTASDITEFEAKVALGGWDLVTLMLQEFDYVTPNFNAYVSDGGKAILTDYNQNPTRGTLFGVTYSGNLNQTAVTMSDGLLSAGVTNPMGLTNLGWTTFSMGMTSSGSGAVAATFPNGDAAIVIGNNGTTIINGFLSAAPSLASDGLALFENEIMALLPFMVTSANGGEVAPTGGIFNFRWLPSRATNFNIDLSTDNGATWKPLGKHYGDNEFEWWVPLQKSNKKKCLVRVTAFDGDGKQVGKDRSDQVFTTEVVKLNFPNGGETWESGSNHNIFWSTNTPSRDVARVKLYFTQNGGTTWKLIDTLDGNPGFKLWTLPDNVTKDKTKCKVKVVLLASDGTKLGSDTSDGKFTITAPLP